MRVSVVAGLLAAGTAHAFSDSTPFLLFSTAELPVEPFISQLQTSARVLGSAKSLLADCPTKNYLLVSQPNAHASDLYSPPDCEAHRLRRTLAGSDIRGRFTVSEVVAPADQSNNLTTDAFRSHIHDACPEARIIEVDLPALPLAPTCEERAEAMGDNDYVLGNALDEHLPMGDLTVVYFSNGAAAPDANVHDGVDYVATFEDPAQVPVNRRHRNVARQESAPSKERDTRGLFEKYQFFTPGIFMSLIVFFILLSILYVGLSAVASLKVPYGAFDKEMGPSAQKKQQ
ncbi:uncharacterized protein SPSK_06487 [Sporothrix schenckii 1099-18]|uniref:Protein BIG1 n=2 Tax=Sporothrix schenckii TaxID=29908 RepID=U7PVY8_SPOS1|nr:uncharacterized protein SPSK_06487 [Sporothrix schenckii 1099-18]ERS98635.1 hypothetical protein HMPREF1624_05422 [Sporothrix schenckii ATCC 58251]KJR89185.1 hypothetical protein SPSK_06487 [Sporothrix schenckii 1099-18]